MTKENVLYTIIGLLFGFNAAFVFVTYANQKALQRASGATTAGETNRQLPSNAVSDQRNVQAAIADATKKATDAPNDFDAQMRAAEQFYQAERFTDALPFLLKANKLKPDDYDALRGLCVVTYQADKFDDAEKWCGKALERKPDDNDMRAGLGLTFLRRPTPNIDRAIIEFKRALENDPRHEMSLQYLAVALARKGDRDGARASLAKLQEINPSNPNLADLRATIESSAAAK